MNVAKEVSLLRRMNVNDLRMKYQTVFGHPTPSTQKTFLIRRIAWKMQANQEGGLSHRAAQRAEELSADLEIKTCPVARRSVTQSFSPRRDPRLPLPGTMLVREYQRSLVTVMVLDDGFEHEGQVHKSLTSLVNKITGSHWNGYEFFHLCRKGERS